MTGFVVQGHICTLKVLICTFKVHAPNMHPFLGVNKVQKCILWKGTVPVTASESVHTEVVRHIKRHVKLANSSTVHSFSLAV